MKLVVCGPNGDHLFVGDSILKTEETEETEEETAPLESGVFPVTPLATVDEEPEAAPRQSGVFPRSQQLKLEGADEECALNLIDAEWDLRTVS
jgi:hypothetical protein